MFQMEIKISPPLVQMIQDHRYSHMDCIDLSTATASIYNLRIQNNGKTLNIPAGFGIIGGVCQAQ